MVHYKLYYFDARGLAEVTRQLFALGKIEFEDIRFNLEGWKKYQAEMPLGHCPVLEVDGEKIPQSQAIIRYVAKLTGHTGKTAFEQAIVDALADQYKDFYAQIKPFHYRKVKLIPATEEEIEKIRIEEFLPARDRYFSQMTSFLEKSKTGFLAGGDLTFADLILAEHVDQMQSTFVPDYTENFPMIAAHQKKVTEQLPKEYLAKRK